MKRPHHDEQHEACVTKVLTEVVEAQAKSETARKNNSLVILPRITTNIRSFHPPEPRA